VGGCHLCVGGKTPPLGPPPHLQTSNMWENVIKAE
jgi:hypothetical protein